MSSWASDTVPMSYDLRELRGVELPATQFLVHDRIPYGLWQHSAPPGGYKSAWASQIEHHIAFGHPIPGLDWQFAQHGDCLVVSPDETAYEMQERSYRILPGGELETDGVTDLGLRFPSIHVRHDPHGADLNQRIAWLLHEIELLEAATGRHVVWVRWDTMGNLLGDRAGVDHYTHAMPLQKLNMLMSNNHRVMFIPNHVGKDGRSIGTVNLVGSANLTTKATITKNANTGEITCLDDGSNDVKMRSGRGWSAALKLKNGLLELTDESPQEASHQLDSQPHQVVSYLAKNGPSTVKELREGTGLTDKVVWKCILRLKNKHEIARREDAHWFLEETGAVAHWPADWQQCELCPCLVDPQRGCVNVRCARFVMDNWPLTMPEGQPEPVSVAIPEARKPADAVAAVAASVAAVPAAAVLEPEPVPDLTGNAAVDKLLELVRASGLYAERRLASPEIKAKMAYENVCLGGAPNRYQLFPDAPPAGRVMIFDRKAAYFQSCTGWYVPNRLHREGNIDYHDVVTRSLAGMFEILFTPFEGPYPDPIGGYEVERGSRLLVPRATLDRVMDSVKAGFRPEPEIMYGLCGKGTERGPLYQWGRWCLSSRKEAAAGDLPEIKEQQNLAFGTLRISDPDKRPGPVDRPDWQYAVIGHHYATINRYVWAALDAGEPCIAAGNTDEIIFAMPDGAGDDWRPKSMKPHLAGGRFAMKDIRDGASWFENPRALHG